MNVFFFSSRRRHTSLRISDWSSDVCSSDLDPTAQQTSSSSLPQPRTFVRWPRCSRCTANSSQYDRVATTQPPPTQQPLPSKPSSSTIFASVGHSSNNSLRSEEHTSELQSLMRNSYAVFCLKKKNDT